MRARLVAAFVLATGSLVACGSTEKIVANDFPCNDARDCPAPKSPCLAPMCMEGSCVWVPAPNGVLGSTHQTAGDCQELHCDGDGEVSVYPDAQDPPASDNNVCTLERCGVSGVERSDHTAGTVCAEGVCNGHGTCGECLPLARECRAMSVLQCDDLGKWGPPTMCDGDQPICEAGACHALTNVALGPDGGCASFGNQRLQCWGSKAIERPIVGPLGSALRTARKFSAGSSGGCIIDGNNRVRCWGDNRLGQLGTGSFDAVHALGPIVLDQAVQVTVGAQHACALLRGGKAACWGRHDYKAKRRAPSALLPPRSSRAIKRQALPLATHSGTQLNLGRGFLCTDAGCIGTMFKAPPPPERTPEQQEVLASKREEVARASATPLEQAPVFVQLAAGGYQTCGLSKVGDVQCFADWSAKKLKLAAVKLDQPARATVRGFAHGCALLKDGTVRCWNDGAENKPAAIKLPDKASHLYAHGPTSCAVVASAGVQCWDVGGPAAPPQWSPP